MSCGVEQQNMFTLLKALPPEVARNVYDAIAQEIAAAHSLHAAIPLALTSREPSIPSKAIALIDYRR